MSISVEQLEILLEKLQRLAMQLRSASSPDTELASGDPLLSLANECEFMLPYRLTPNELLTTAQRKIQNVEVLLERARENQDIPPDARAAAANEDNPVRPGLH